MGLEHIAQQEWSKFCALVVLVQGNWKKLRTIRFMWSCYTNKWSKMNWTSLRRNEWRLRFTLGRRSTDPALLRRRQPEAPDAAVSGLRRRLQHRVERRQSLAAGRNCRLAHRMEYRRWNGHQEQSWRLPVSRLYSFNVFCSQHLPITAFSADKTPAVFRQMVSIWRRLWVLN